MAQSVGEVALDIVAGKNTLKNTIKNAMGEAQGVANSASSGISNALGKIGSVASAVGKTVAVGIGVASTAVVAMGKTAVSAYADYEQLVGGVETLMGTKGVNTVEEYAEKVGQSVDYVRAEFEMLQKAQSDAMTNAKNAYKDAGLSVNEYMETINGMASALNQCTASELETVEYANRAVIDMADNANKMGTSMEAIQNAYSGFTKQNYTMLDNLKLGYGGTKTEMERLLKDAEAISGIKYDISSYADIIDAIHVIQTEMGITGTTAEEARKTISGSLAMMKSSWQNLLVGMGDDTQDFGALVDQFVESVDIVGDNLLPRIETVLGGVVKLVQGLAPKIIAKIPELVSKLLPSIITASVSLIQAVVSIIPDLVDAIVAEIPAFIDGLIQIVDALIQALPTAMESLVNAFPTLVPALVAGMVQLMVLVCQVIPQIIQPIIDNLPLILTTVVDALIQNLPILIDGFIQLIGALVMAVPQILSTLWDVITDYCQQGTSLLFGKIQEWIMELFPKSGETVMKILGTIKDAFVVWINSVKAVFSVITEVISVPFKLAWNAVKLVWNVVVDYFKTIWENIKAVFSVVDNVLAGDFEGAWNSVKQIWNNCVGFFKDIISNIKLAFSGVYDILSSPFKKAKDAITEVVNNIKNLFANLKLKFPDIALPHFSISPKGWKMSDLFMGVKPTLSIDWYAKAMNNPMIMTKPTIFGYDAETGKLLGGGEAGSELVVGTNTLLSMIKSAVASVFSGAKMTVDVPALQNVGAGRAGSGSELSDKMDRLIELFKHFIESGNSDMTVPIYIGNELIDEYILNKNNRNVLRSGGHA